MQRLRSRHLVFSGQITAFLSLIAIILVSFVGVMIESASISLAKSMNQADLILAMESIFAEYDPELLEKYDIFAKQGNDLHSISQRLSYYGVGNLEHEILQMELLTDGLGQEFYRQAVTSMGGKVDQTRPSIENTFEEEAKAAKENYENLLEEEETAELPELEMDTESFLLSRVLPKEQVLSSRRIADTELASRRELETGVGTYGKAEETLAGKWLFATYLTEHFLDYTKHQNIHPLSYETEYLLAGNMSDQENLEWVAKRILAIRIGLNYAALLTDQERISEAEALAIALSVLIMTPGAKEIIKQAFLFFWAYEDSIEDLQSLYRGERVPLLGEGENEGQGVSYEDYLKALLFAEKTETLCMRALDLIELNLGIRADTFVTGLKIESTGRTRRNLPYVCTAEFTYE